MLIEITVRLRYFALLAALLVPVLSVVVYAEPATETTDADTTETATEESDADDAATEETATESGDEAADASEEPATATESADDTKAEEASEPAALEEVEEVEEGVTVEAEQPAPAAGNEGLADLDQATQLK